MFTEGVLDMCITTVAVAFQPKENRAQYFEDGKKKILRRYFPVFEKVGALVRYDVKKIGSSS